MQNTLDKVIACLKFLELNPNMEQYEWRFLTQKIAFLAKALGMDIDYCFTIYVAGPYSRELNLDYYPFENKERINSLQTDYDLTPSDIEVLEKIKRCCDIYNNKDLMESTSTIVFFTKENPNLTDDNLFAKLKLLKPHLSDYNSVIGISKAKELLFKPEYLTNAIRREMEEWDRFDH